PRRWRSRSRMAAPRFVVGVDLGTTNTACAWIDTRAGRTIRIFDVTQVLAPGETAPRPTLPSFVYLAGPHDLPPQSLDLPWAAGRDFCVGLLAREQGGRVPGRLVASAKSWLCHGGVDRAAAILPGVAAEGVPRISPVDASARTLRHPREACAARGRGAPQPRPPPRRAAVSRAGQPLSRRQGGAPGRPGARRGTDRGAGTRDRCRRRRPRDDARARRGGGDRARRLLRGRPRRRAAAAVRGPRGARVGPAVRRRAGGHAARRGVSRPAARA